MHRRELNLTDLCGLLAVVCGVVGGFCGSISLRAGWLLATGFAVCGLAVGFATAKLLGRIAYACLDRAGPDRSAFAVMLWGLSSVAVSIAMPLTSGLAALAIPSAVLAPAHHSSVVAAPESR